MHAQTLSEVLDVLVDDSLDRRIGYFTFALNFYLGGLDTFGYHLTNLLIHIVSAWLIFWLLATTLKLPRLNASSGATAGIARHADKLAFFAALIWLVHPVQTQAVTYIVQRLASLSAMLFLASLAFFLKGRLSAERERYLYFGLSAVAGLLALGVKQNAAVLPLFVVLYELYFFHKSPWEALKKRKGLILGLGGFLVAVTLVYLGPTFWGVLQECFAQREFTMWERLLSESRVVLYYLSLIALPLPSRLNLDYDFPASSSLVDPFTTLISVLVILGALGFALKTATKRPLLSFGILWYFGNLAMESSIIPLDLVYEHRLYLPSLAPIAAFTVLAFVLSSLTSKDCLQKLCWQSLWWSWDSGPFNAMRYGKTRYDCGAIM